MARIASSPGRAVNVAGAYDGTCNGGRDTAARLMVDALVRVDDAVAAEATAAELRAMGALASAAELRAMGALASAAELTGTRAG